MTAAGALLLAFLLAQGHGAKTGGATGGGGGGGKRAAARGSGGAPRAAAAPEVGGATAATAGASAAPAEKRAGDGGGGDSKSASADPVGPGGKTIKSKTYTFGAMDVEGKLKTPQLLYFLNRVKLELDMSAPDKRSFMKELEKSADDKNL
jgi:hypothetical protein